MVRGWFIVYGHPYQLEILGLTRSPGRGSQGPGTFPLDPTTGKLVGPRTAT